MKDLSKKQLQKFSYLIGLGLPIIIGWIVPLILGHHFRTWTLYVSVPILILGIVKPMLLLYPYKAWMSLGHVLGWVNSRLILGLVFLIILQPIALIMKFFNYDPLKKRKSSVKSYRESKLNHHVDLTRIF